MTRDATSSARAPPRCPTSFWRVDRQADYGQLNGLAHNRINPKLIITHRDDILRVAGSLSTGTVRASELLRALQGGGRPTLLGRAIAELGRAAKTLRLLSYVESDAYRRCIAVHINRHEGRHSVGRVIFHGNRGELRQPLPPRPKRSALRARIRPERPRALSRARGTDLLRQQGRAP